MMTVTPDAHAFEEPRPWPLLDGDRIVLVGDTLIERDQRYGYLETFLTIENPELNLTFRNLGWSGDSVAGLSRAGFDPPEAGFRALIEQIKAAKPTVLIVGYGMADSFDGESGVPRFVAGLNALVQAVAPTNARVVRLSPIPHQSLGQPLPDPAAHNHDLALYTEAIRRADHGLDGRFVELLDWFRDRSGCTDDGIHLNEKGYWQFAQAISFNLGQVETHGMPGPIVIRHDGKVLETHSRKVFDVKATATSLHFVVQGKTLPAPTEPQHRLKKAHTTPWTANERTPDMRIPGLTPGNFALKIDGKTVAMIDAATLGKGIDLWTGPERDQVEQLRKTINEKNLLFFHRWRPQNNTYLFGFRKHEQGNNAIEIPKFDPLVEAKEREIARLRKTVPHVYELIRESEVAR